VSRIPASGGPRSIFVSLWVALVLWVANPVIADEAREAAADQDAHTQEAPEAVDVIGSEPEFRIPPTPIESTPRSARGRPVDDLRGPKGTSPGLDALLHLPTNFVSEEPRAVAGAGESVWRRRFEKADQELSEARSALAATKSELEGVAVSGGSSQWSIAAPGGGGGGDTPSATSPLSFRLRQQLRVNREQVTAAERARRELQIEADLAGVPQRWRSDSETPVGPDSN
jgi:hypothetical protein